MKRINLVLDEQLLSEARTVLGSKTYSAAVSTALREAIRIKRLQSLESFFGSGLWAGDLPAIRADHEVAGRRRAIKRSRR